jgi:sulfur-carrier protein
VIEITARYYAAFRERAGLDSERVSTRATTAGELFEQVSGRHGFADAMPRCKVAINDELVDWDTRIGDGDVVLFFPPVAGG